MPLGASRIALLARSSVTATAEVIRLKGAIYKYGSTSQDYNQSKFGHSSFNFGGSGDYLATKGGIGDAIADSDYTAECFIRYNSVPPSGSSYSKILDNRKSSFGSYGWSLYTNGSSYLVTYRGTGSTTNAFISQSATINTGTWYHLALVKSGTTLSLYVDGTELGNTSVANTTYAASDEELWIGAGHNYADYVDGHIDEIRISKTARYTSGFTVPSSPFTNDSNTLLLLHGDASISSSTWIYDDNGEREMVAVKVEGNTKSRQQFQAIAGCSLQFDGSGDFLRLKRNPAMSLGSGDFTIEYNLRLDSTGTQVVFADQDNSSQAYAMMVHSGSLKMWMSSDGSSWDIMSGNVIKSSISTSTWYHIAVVRNGNSIKAYVDGTETTGFATTTSSSLNDTGNDVCLGGLYEGSTAYLDGNMSDVRFSTTARYTGTFTPSTVKLENDSDTVFLIHPDSQNNSQHIRDDNGKGRSPLTVDQVFGGSLSIGEKQFGFTSHRQTAEYDGIKVRDFNKYQRVKDIGSNSPFTIECWLNRSGDNSSQNTQVIVDISSNGNKIYYDETANRLKYQTEGIDRITSDSDLSTSTWYHVAVVRDSSYNVKMYIDGSQVGSTYTNDDRNWANYYEMLIGVSNSGTKSWIGYIEEFRISNVERYTADFTVPTEQFQNDADTVCLFHFDTTQNGATDRYFDDNGTYSD